MIRITNFRNVIRNSLTANSQTIFDTFSKDSVTVDKGTFTVRIHIQELVLFLDIGLETDDTTKVTLRVLSNDDIYLNELYLMHTSYAIRNLLEESRHFNLDSLKSVIHIDKIIMTEVDLRIDNRFKLKVISNIKQIPVPISSSVEMIDVLQYPTSSVETVLLSNKDLLLYLDWLNSPDDALIPFLYKHSRSGRDVVKCSLCRVSIGQLPSQMRNTYFSIGHVLTLRLSNFLQMVP